jgi:hypothetical protein
MRNGQNNKRMRGRNRSKGHHSGGGGGHHHQNPLTRVYESNGPDVKIRGTAHHVGEKYLQLARDAQSAGDPVTAENYFQHAEHYFRLIAAAQEQFRQQNPYYQAPQAGAQDTGEGAFEGEEDESGQPVQGQPSQGQASFGGQPNFPNQQPYPPREQPQPYGNPEPQPYQGRQQHQQPYNNQQQPPYQQPQPEVNDGERLPSFITGGQPQPAAQGFAPNGHDSNQGGDRFPRHRRRRHRTGPRPEMAGAAQEVGGDGLEPGNS